VNAATPLLQVETSGISLRLVDGKIKVVGPREAVAQLVTTLREHHAELVDALRSEHVASLRLAAADLGPTLGDWKAMDAAYLAHHFNCVTCIAAGRSVRAGLRCGTGAALWVAYDDSDN